MSEQFEEDSKKEETIEEIEVKAQEENKPNAKNEEIKEKGNKGRVSKKPEEERLNNVLTSSVTKQFKGEIKEVAAKEDESVSQFLRESIKDIVYHDMHPEKEIHELVNVGREKHSTIRKAKEEKVEEVEVHETNTVSVGKMKNVLNIFKAIDLEHIFRPIQKGVKIDFASNNMMTLTVSNENTLMRDTIPFISDFPETFSKSIVVDYAILLKLFDSVKAKVAKISVKDVSLNSIYIEFDNGQTVKVFAQNGEEYPTIEESDLTYITNIKTEDFIKLLRSTEYLQAEKRVSPDYHGIRFGSFPDHIDLAVSDTYRMGHMIYDIHCDSQKAFLIDADAIYAALKALPLTSSETIKLSYTKYKVFSSKESLKIQAKDIDMFLEVKADNFSEHYKDLFSLEGKVYARLEVKANEMYEAIKSLSAFYNKAESGEPTIRVNLYKHNNELVIKTSVHESNQTSVAIKCEMLENKFEDDTLFIVDPQYLMESLKVLSSQKNYLTHPEGKVVLEFVDKHINNASDFKYLIMKPAETDKHAIVINTMKE